MDNDGPAGREVPMTDPCHDWPLGKCKWGDSCTLVHHDNLDPELQLQRKPQNYMVPTETGVACARCMQAGSKCDKAGRGGKDDPCSQCRHFGGPNCQCVLVNNASYNDQLWKVMMTRRGADYDLPPEHDRCAAKAFPKDKSNPSVPGPMPADKVKADWHGDSVEQLLASEPFIPAYVRAFPRAYLVPPQNLSTPMEISDDEISDDTAADNTTAGVFAVEDMKPEFDDSDDPDRYRSDSD